MRSSYCRFELDAFLARERALGRSDLIFPILYIRVPGLEDSALWEADPVLSTIARRQFVDWREFRHLDVYSTPVGKAIERLCSKIVDALERPDASEVEREKRRQEEAERQRQRAEQERRAHDEEEQRQRVEAELRRQEEESRRAQEEEEQRQRAAAARLRQEEERRRAQEEEEQRQRAEAERAPQSSLESSNKPLDGAAKTVAKANADGTDQSSEEPAATAPEAIYSAREADKDGVAVNREQTGVPLSTEKEAKGKPEKKSWRTAFPRTEWVVATLGVALVAAVVIL